MATFMTFYESITTIGSSRSAGIHGGKIPMTASKRSLRGQQTVFFDILVF
jgi:hypothetical protein